MVEHAASSACKRRLDAEQGDSTQHRAAKIRRTETRHRYPPRFWDSLSEIRLTRGALEELDRRCERAVLVPTTTVPSQQTRRLLRSDYRRLKSLASSGGPDLGSIRGYSAKLDVTRHLDMSQSNSQSRKRSLGSSTPRSSGTNKTKTTTPYSGEFEQKLIDNGIFPEGYKVGVEKTPKPANLAEIRERLAEARSSLSPSTFSESAFDDFQDANRRAKSESKAMADVIPAITGLKDKNHESAGDILFNRLDKFDPDLSTPNPDRYYGAKPAQIDARVRRDLSSHIVPSNRTNLPAAPNFFLEGKSAAGRPDVAQRQAMYDGAIGARGILRLQNYRSPVLTYDGNAYTISATYSDGQLKMYTTHPRQASDGRGTEYHMTQLDTFAMTGNMNSFRQGATAYRNARDWTQQKRNHFIEDANAIAQRQSETASFDRSRSTQASVENNEDGPDSDTSMDELALEYDVERRQKARTTYNEELDGCTS